MLAGKGSDYQPFNLPVDITESTIGNNVIPAPEDDTTSLNIPTTHTKHHDRLTTMTGDMSPPNSHRIYKGVIFDRSINNYPQWLESSYNILGWNSLTRYAVPLKEGELAIKKEKPTKGTEAEVELWEDKAEQAMVLIKESLGSHSWIVKDAETPSAAFQKMFKLYSGSTGNDAVRLETQWVNEKPIGDDFMAYIARMSIVRDKLEKIGVKREEKDLVLRMMSPLGAYPEGHALREAWKWLDKTFQHDPTNLNLEYFTRFVQSAINELRDEDVKTPTFTRKSRIDDEDMRALSVLDLSKRVSELALAVANANDRTRNQQPPRFRQQDGGSYTSSGCRFCRSPRHITERCDHPNFNIDTWNRHRGLNGRGDQQQGREGGHAGRRNGKWEKANAADTGNEGGVLGVTNLGSGKTMNKTCDCYEQIRTPRSSGIDPGAACEGSISNTSLAPCVRRFPIPSEIKDSDAADMAADHICTSESISEQLYNTTIASSDTSTWDTIIDSGCTKTMWADANMFSESTNYRPCEIDVKVGDGFAITAQGMGDVKLTTPDGSMVHIPNCLWVPGLKLNLISVAHLDSEGFTTHFEDGMAEISKEGKVILSGEKRNNLYRISLSTDSESVNHTVACDLLHRRLGHLAARKLKRLPSLVAGLDLADVANVPIKFKCRACAEAMGHRGSFSISNSIAEGVFDLLHMDIAGPAEIASIGGNRYLLVIVDDYSRYYHTVLLQKKSDAFDAAIRWITLHERRTGRRVKRIRTDGGGEFTGDKWVSYCVHNGVMHEKTVPYTPEQNGRAERAVGVIKNGTRTYLLQSGLPKAYWGAASANFTYTRNVLPTTSAPTSTPFELFYGSKPDVSFLRVFGCVAYVHVPRQVRRGAWGPRATRMIFLGYAQEEGTKAWIFFDPVRKQRVVSVHAQFWEDEKWSSDHREGENGTIRFEDDDLSLQTAADDAVTPSTTPSQPSPSSKRVASPPSGVVAVRKSTRIRQEPQRYLPSRANTVEHSLVYEIAYLLTLNEHQPKLDSILELAFIASSEKDHRDPRFNGAKAKELQSMYDNKVWDLVPLPKGERAIASRWLCTDKLLADLSTMEKARLIVLGHLQIPGKDFQEIFAPVIKMESVRMLLAIIAKYDLEFVQGDVKTAFLYGPLQEVVYMKQPPGFEEKGKEGWVCRLKKAVYGLHQAPRAFYLHITNVLSRAGFKSIHGDPSIFVKNANGHVSFIGLYVDDAIIASSSPSELRATKQFLMANFKMTWTDTPKMLLGIELHRDREAGTLRLSQQHYAEEILETFGMTSCTPKKLPMLNTFPAFPGDQKPLPDKRYPYLQFIGKLNYLARSTRPDLAFVASHLATFCSTYQREHWDACLDVMRYIKGTLDTSITFTKHSPDQPVGYSDANYAGDSGDRKSISGYAFMYAGGMISWKSKKQPIVAHSSSESELVALDSAAREALWLTTLFDELARPVQLPFQIFEDNQGTINITKNPVNHPGTKHIAVRYFAVRDWIQEGRLRVDYLPTNDMLADAFTKPLNGAKLRDLCARMGMEFRSRNRSSDTVTKGSEIV